MSVTAVIAAGGLGSRLGISGGKQMLTLEGKALLSWTLNALAAARHIDSFIIACDPERVSEYAEVVLGETSTDKPVAFVAGGDTRQESVEQALSNLEGPQREGIVLVHDGARPFIDPATVDAALEHLVQLGEEVAGLVFGQPSVDTIKKVDEQAAVIETLKRSELWSVQTPQIFWAPALIDAYAAAQEQGFVGTDDASLVEHAGMRVMMYESSRQNIKITHEEDIALAQYLIRQPRS